MSHAMGFSDMYQNKELKINDPNFGSFPQIYDKNYQVLNFNLLKNYQDV